MSRAVATALDQLTRAAELHRGATGPWIGVEHEFRVVDRGRAVDFRELVGGLGVGRGGLDPGDARAHRLRSGALLTADGREAEVATPPVDLRPGFSATLLGHAERAEGELVGALGGRHLEGYSTHLSVQVPDRLAVRTARRFLTTCAPAMMLLMDRAESPGLLVRPRRGRLELCGEHVAGDQLRAASVFAAATTTALATRRPPRSLRVRGRCEPAVERYGWYVDRRAFGPDLYELGRGTPLGGRPAQDQLARCWDWSRGAAVAVASRDEVELVDRVVDGTLPLPLEVGSGLDLRVGATCGTEVPPDAPFGSVLHPRRRGDLDLTARLVTWAFVVLDVSDGRTTFHLCIPGRELDATLAAIDAGTVDDVLARLVAAADGLPVLASADQTERLGAFGSIGWVGDLVPPERDALTGRIGGGSGGRGSTKDRGHQAEPASSPPASPPRRARGWQLAAAGAAAVALVALVVNLTSGDDDSGDVVAGMTVPTAVANPADDDTRVDDGPFESGFRPIAFDTCAVLDDELVTAYAQEVADHAATQLYGGGSAQITSGGPIAPPFDGFSAGCDWGFFVQFPDFADAIEVRLIIERFDSAGSPGMCTMGAPVDLGAVDSAAADGDRGQACIGDLQLEVFSNGSAFWDGAPPPSLLALLADAAVRAADADRGAEGEPLVVSGGQIPGTRTADGQSGDGAVLIDLVGTCDGASACSISRDSYFSDESWMMCSWWADLDPAGGGRSTYRGTITMYGAGCITADVAPTSDVGFEEVTVDVELVNDGTDLQVRISESWRTSWGNGADEVETSTVELAGTLPAPVGPGGIRTG